MLIEGHMNNYSIILILVGSFSLAGAIFNWDWFITGRKARFFVDIFGRQVTRVIYGLIGLVLIVWGILMTLGIGT